MLSISKVLFAALAVTSAWASPVDPAMTNQIKRADFEVHCGTTSDATLSDCRKLLDDDGIWNSAFNVGNTCTFNNVLTGQFAALAYNVACHGNCCVYIAATAGNTINPDNLKFRGEDVRNTAKSLMGCGNPGSNKINVLGRGTTSGVCISNGNGCGDCFDDNDFSYVAGA